MVYQSIAPFSSHVISKKYTKAPFISCTMATLADKLTHVYTSPRIICSVLATSLVPHCTHLHSRLHSLPSRQVTIRHSYTYAARCKDSRVDRVPLRRRDWHPDGRAGITIPTSPDGQNATSALIGNIAPQCLSCVRVIDEVRDLIFETRRVLRNTGLSCKELVNTTKKGSRQSTAGPRSQYRRH